MAKFIGINPLDMNHDAINNMFDIELNSFRHVTYVELNMSAEAVIWLQHINELSQALTLHSLGLTNKEIFTALYDTPPLIPQ